MTHERLFPPWSNTVFWVVLGFGAILVLSLVAFPMLWVRTPYVTGEDEIVTQPVKFDHRHHAGDDGIDCLYCHGNAVRSPHAGVPPTSRCMGCHAQIWPGAPELAKVRASFFEGTPIAWRRVNRLPGFVYFDHSIHLAKGIGCVECHGRVDRMAEVYAVRTLTMRFCLDCHRDPAPHVRPRDRVADMTYEMPPMDVRRALAARLGVRSLTHCSTCHR